MRRSQKSKKVTWASDVNLCQITRFLSEECPSQVGTTTQDHLQAKALQSDDNFPPGFEGMQPANLWSVKLSQIPLMKWKCPPRFEVNCDWQVVAGEESGEQEAQSRREMRVLEAIYPRLSAIPPNPSGLAFVEEDSIENGQNTPMVPLTPIEDEDTAPDTSFNNNPMMSQPQHSFRGTFSSQSSSTINPRGVGLDIVAAAQTALTSIMPNNNQRSLIDTQLLIKILSDPKMVEQLVTIRGLSSAPQSVPSSIFHGIPVVSSTIPSNIPNIPSSSTPNTPSSFMHSMLSTRTQCIPNIRSPPSRPIPNGPFYPPSNVGSMGAKDINYYKSLIQQHGGERREILPQFAHQSTMNQETLNIMKSREYKPKIMKPCIYFNTPRGCRNGANCAYQHDVSSQKRSSGISEVQSAKRVKLDRGITCT